jgi:hypothetical protein
MLDEPPPEEPPARALAMAGAKAMLAQNNSAGIVHQLVRRIAIVLLTQEAERKVLQLDMVRAGAAKSTRRSEYHPRRVVETEAPMRGLEPVDPLALARLLD